MSRLWAGLSDVLVVVCPVALLAAFGALVGVS